MSHLLNAITSIIVALGSFFVPHHAQTPTLGDYNPSGGGTYRLQSSIGSSDTSVTLTSFKEPISNIKYTMSYLNSSIEYGTIEPQSNNREFISFTGITQNSDGTAQLTGVIRGLASSYPFTASTTLQLTHSGQTIFILSNPPQLTNQYANRNNQDTILAIWNFAALPTSTQTCANGFDFCTKTYIDGIAVSGGATSTYSNIGFVQLANQAQIGSSTASSTAAGPLVIENIFATTTPGSQCTSNIFHCIVATNFGKIAQSFFDLTVSWTFTGAVNIAASAAKQLTLNSVAYTFPTAQGAASTTLMNDGAGTLKWGTPPGGHYQTITGTDLVFALGAFATSASVITIPAGVMTASSTIRVSGMFGNNSTDGATCALSLRDSATSVTLATISGFPIGAGGMFEMNSFANNSPTSQTYIGRFITINSGATAGAAGNSEGTSAFNFTTTPATLVLVGTSPNGNGSCTVSSFEIDVTL